MSLLVVQVDVGHDPLVVVFHLAQLPPTALPLPTCGFVGASRAPAPARVLVVTDGARGSPLLSVCIYLHRAITRAPLSEAEPNAEARRPCLFTPSGVFGLCG